jgi:hypothetical protein
MRPRSESINPHNSMKLLNEFEVQETYGLRVGTLRQWRFKGGPLAYYKIGRSCRYAVADIEAFLASCKRKSTSDPGGEGGGK